MKGFAVVPGGDYFSDLLIDIKQNVIRDHDSDIVFDQVSTAQSDTGMDFGELPDAW